MKLVPKVYIVGAPDKIIQPVAFDVATNELTCTWSREREQDSEEVAKSA